MKHFKHPEDGEGNFDKVEIKVKFNPDNIVWTSPGTLYFSRPIAETVSMNLNTYTGTTTYTYGTGTNRGAM